MRVLALSLLTAAAVAGSATAAEAQEFQLRAGVDVRPLVGYETESGTVFTIADYSYLGITVAPGLRLAKVFAVELALTPLIPMSGDPVAPDFAMLLAPGAIVDLQLVYLRGSVPIRISGDSSIYFEVAAGISFLGHGYIGAVFDYDTAGLMQLGAEAGWKF